MQVVMRRWVKWWPIIIILISGLCVLGIAHDDGIYKQSIMKITAVKTTANDKQSDQFENKDRQITQRVTGTITNGRDKGERLTINNTYMKSQATTQAYYKHQHVFLTLHRHDGKITSSTISVLKRDTSLAFMVWLTLSVLLILMRFSGAMAFLSVVVNAVLFAFAVNWNADTQGSKVLFIFGLLAVVFAALTLLIVIGPNRQMVMTLITTICGTAISIVIALLVFMFTNEKGVYYESMQYVTQLPKPLFLAETLLGSLGAVMDESTDIIASLTALKEERPDVTASQIFKSGRQIGGEIMGPLINVLFFIFVADTLPLALLYFKNANSWGYTFNMTMSLGVIQSLISGIGIVLTVPLACGITSIMLGGSKPWARLRH
ncbi:YibE/F family protein [Secundilactobacillus paracollinoides]|uniref:YibE/F family protein n=1 Tax=Secundilactobacillus paracollinoides TaxID=240427 RepID=UPI0006CF255A|nr:YibE/F family protein [Secundilactobacillus paracollinoides]